ncbi:hypothetical protein [Microbacterium sp. nov. GSS16]|uniref:hypothetical protein n=1 Tax=Microbacterium sp. nov. GSS16 TaxID=3019890 RepID=UPI002304E41C|nr:hypothetical protein [Microbacterium sp. nov. GSS16]WCD91499.1 hypothetical protein PGB26_07235 [Microbacterium sp. nov. GSS16]
MDDFAVQPHCPECDIVMRTEPHAFACPHCGHLQPLDEVEMPREFDGADFDDGRRRT